MESVNNNDEPGSYCYNLDECGPRRSFIMDNSHHSIKNESYKSLHEAFVSNNTGTTPWELFIVVSPWTWSTFCIQLMYSFNCVCNKSKLFMFFFEFIFAVMTQLYVVTLGADHCYYFVMALVIVTLFLVLLRLILAKMNGAVGPKSLLECWVVPPDTTIFSCLDNMRSQLCLLVCLSILAVDFPIYPRRYAKTETFGYGLMDTGIGFFMLVNGIVAPETKKKYQFSRGNTAALKKSLVSSVPLLLLGVIRVIAVKSLNYQEHVTEYGVHWNFFFSLAFAKIGCSLIFMLFPPIASGLVAIFLSASYQVCLHFGLDDIIFNGFDGHDTRSNFFDANREGIASCVSFTCMYLAGIQIGYILFRTGLTLRAWIRTSFAILFITSSLAVVATLSHFFINPASRRLVNLTYIAWLSSFLFFLLWEWIMLDLLDVILKYQSEQEESKYATAPLISKSISYNFLLIFLLANVLTGVVNMAMNTIFASNLVSYWVMTAYIFSICVVAVICKMKKWQLKMG